MEKKFIFGLFVLLVCGFALSGEDKKEKKKSVIDSKNKPLDTDGTLQMHCITQISNHRIHVEFGERAVARPPHRVIQNVR